ncbi:MAG: VCBS repeat-containing protein [Alphaproteobacteria bacterium]|nr:VCBS repeat-containing protein [Alphaproteobacteria bacterium]
MLVLLTTTGALAAPTEGHWWRAPTVPAGLRDVATDGERLVGLTRAGGLVELRDGGWVELAAPTPTTAAAAGLVADGGTFWARGSVPPVMVPYGDGAWGEREPVPVRGITGAASIPAGLVVSGLDGTRALRDAGGWHALETLDGHLIVRPDGEGGLWWWAGAVAPRPELFRTDASGAVVERGPSLPHWSRFENTLTVDAAHRPVWGGDALYRLDATGRVETVLETPVLAAVQADALWTASTDGGTRDGEPAAMPVPLAKLGAMPDGGVWGLSDDGVLYTTREGPGIGLSDVSLAWGAGAVYGRAAVVADVDGDGLDDVLGAERNCRARMWLQRSGTFADATTEWGYPACAWGVAAGDLDGDGRPELVTIDWRDAVRRIDVYRNVGRFERVTDRVLVGEEAREADQYGMPQLVDIDGDLDLDLYVSAQGTPDAPRRAWLWVNDGLGRLAPVPLPERGLGYAAFVAGVYRSDLDGDGDGDFVLRSYWGEGHHVLAGRADGSLEDVSETAGLRGVYGVPMQGALVDLDRDGLDDVFFAGREAPMVWHNDGGLHFSGATDRFGLSGAPVLDGFALEDLDGDGWIDLAGCNAAACGLWRGGEAGFTEAAGSLPRDGLSAGVVLALDLGGDGDADVLLLREDGATLLENGVRSGPVAYPRAVPFGALRRLRWAGAPDLVMLGVYALLVAFAAGWVRRSGSRLVLGRGMPAVGGLWGAGGAAWLLAADATPGARGLVAAAGLAGVGLLVAVEPRWHRARSARRVAGYRLVEELGRGGMGVVFLAREDGTGREVALKLVDPRLLEREEDLELYREEARIGADIAHPGVVRILGWGEWTTPVGDGMQRTAYLVMERIRGPTLRAWAEGRVVPVAEACWLVSAICDALAAVHALDVVHRDIKPSNVMLAPGGRVVVMDFGAARYVGQVTRQTRSVLGTLGYMAPEQGRGLAADPRGDVYAAGVVLYELLAGERPFEADNMVTLMARVIADPPPRVPREDVDDALWAVIERMLAKIPEERPHAREVSALLAPWCGSGVRTALAAPVVDAETVTGARRA